MYVHVPGKIQITLRLGFKNNVWCNKFLYETSVLKENVNLNSFKT